MGLFERERQSMSWRDQTLDSMSAPPLPLMVFSGLVMTLLYFASWSEHRERVERRKSGVRFAILLLPLAVFLAVNAAALRRRMVRYSLGVPTTPVYVAAEEEGGGGSSAGLVLVLGMVLVMVHYQSAFQSGWFGIF